MEEERFEYVYSAPTEEEREEIKRIRAQYLEKTPVEETKLERLRRLNGKVVRRALAVALTFGIVGTLTFGGGLALVLEKGVWLWGTLLSVTGAALFGCAYPVHRLSLRRSKKKYGEEILELSESLLRGE